MTQRAMHRFTIDGPVGALELAVNVAVPAPRGIALVAHPHPLQGGTLDNKVAQTLARTFCELGYASVRFNFRGVGASEGHYDEGIGETDDAMAALEHAQAAFGAGLPTVLAGFSFGCYVQSRLAGRIDSERVVFVGPAAGRYPLAAVPGDAIVIHGEDDDVVPLTDVFGWARPQQLPVIVFPGCGHFFHGHLSAIATTIARMWQGHVPAVPGA